MTHNDAVAYRNECKAAIDERATIRHCRIILSMYTVAETDVFVRYASAVWSADEREDFVTWIANNPLSGDVIPGTGGLRKVRYTRQGMGKRGGVRVVYYNILDDGEIWLLIVYSKSKFDNLPVTFLNQLKSAVLENTHGRREKN